MRKLLITIALFTTLIACAQEYPIYSPVKIYGTLMLHPVTGLPLGAPLMLVNFNDTLRIQGSDAQWHPLWPVKEGGEGTVTTTGTPADSYLSVFSGESSITGTNNLLVRNDSLIVSMPLGVDEFGFRVGKNNNFLDFTSSNDYSSIYAAQGKLFLFSDTTFITSAGNSVIWDGVNLSLTGYITTDTFPTYSWVNSKISAAVLEGDYEFGNGLTESEGSVSLGGAFTSDIDLVGDEVSFKVRSDSENSFLEFTPSDNLLIAKFATYNHNPITGRYFSLVGDSTVWDFRNYVNSSSNSQFSVYSSGSIYFKVATGEGVKSIHFNSSALNYTDDYSSSFTLRSIPDSAYVAYMISQSGSGLSDSTWTEATITDTLHLEGVIKWDTDMQKSPYSFLFRNNTTGIIYVDSSDVVDASWAIKMQLPDIIEFINDTVNSEYKWFYMEGDSIIYTYGLNYGNESPNTIFQKLAAMQELSIRWLAEQAHKQNELEARIRAVEANAIEHKTALLLKIIIVFLGICVGLLTFFAFTKQNFITHE